MSPAEFAKEMAARFQESAQHLKVQVVENLKLEAECSEVPPRHIDLRRAYHEYMENPASRAEVIVNWVSAFVEAMKMTPNDPIDPARILPILKPENWPAGSPNSVHQSFSEDLVVAYALDARHTMRHLTDKDLGSLKMSVEALHKLALANLKKFFPAPTITEKAGVYQIRCDGNYDASLILLNEFWDKVVLKVRGHLVVAVPARYSLLVTGSGFPEGIQRVSHLAQEVFASCFHTLSPRLFVRRDEKFVPYPATATST